jgi:mono/diheme cytochrome c family protein
MLISTILFAIACTAIFLSRKKVGLFWSGAAFFVVTVLYLQHGIVPPAPAALVLLYAGTAFLAMLLYVTSSKQALEGVWNPIRAVMVEQDKRMSLYGLLLVIPGVVAFQSYMGNLPSTDAPPRIRSVHPPPPTNIKLQTPGMAEVREFNVVAGDSPIRPLAESDPEKFAEYVARGKEVYYENCFYCHGDTLAADGHYARSLNPMPANFQDPGVLPQLTEAFLFWRVAKGGPGMPDAGGPWDSSMPAWEKFISEEDMWNVIAFLYDYTGYKPRAAESAEGH